LRCVYGDAAIADRIKKAIRGKLSTQPLLFREFIKNTSRVRIPSGIWGQLLPERHGEMFGCIDVKAGGYLPLVKNMRLFALWLGVDTVSTIGRIQSTGAIMGWTDEWIKALTEALQSLYYFREMAEVQMDNGGLKGGSFLRLQTLDHWQIKLLKRSLGSVRKLQTETLKFFRLKGL
jgi:signal-transduction protein with cAMP-binding, CBS, and nucleotidyltransferase domain